MDRKGRASVHVSAPADVVFATVTDLRRLPTWNRRILRVVDMPPELVAGADWVVEIRLMGKRFKSRSTVLELDPLERRFVHRSKPDDDNPSSTVWTWHVEPEGEGSRLTVSWHLQPLTPSRRLLAAPMRARQIPRDDMPASLAALVTACEAQVSGRHP
jgi:uncharacterized protein YndB with AHSA1/START domain